MRKVIPLLLAGALFLAGCEEKKQEGVVIYDASGKPIRSEYNGVYYDKPAPNFCLKTYEGGKEKTVCLDELLKEKDVVLVFFGYTHCPDVCPAAMMVLKRAMKKLDEDEKKRVGVLFVSVDPERDDPKTVSEYAKYFDKSFIGLTASPEEIKKVAKDYKVFYKKIEREGSEDYLVDHSALIYLITKDGRIKLIYTTSKQKPELIAKDIKKILD
ncbi:MAG: SCO family protein [Aquificae bacterium]|nr:SCO family protein [Aquificota bacterium]